MDIACCRCWIKLFSSGVIQGLSVGCCLIFRSGKKVSIAKFSKDWNAASFSVQFDSDSRNDQSVDANYLPKQDFMLGFTFPLNIDSTFVL